MKVLSINTYGGSLLLGGRALGATLVGSYEDHNFGSDIQAQNFPEVPLIRHRHQWPQQDLSDTIVIGHPPCSAFSVQNNSPQARGTNSAAFACTKDLLGYAARNGARAMMIESVPGALSGAWWVHSDIAERYGYHLYRILENGCMWGAQWRERFWCLYVKKGEASPNIKIDLTPCYQNVREVVTGHEDGPSAGNQDVLLERQKVRFKKELDMTDEELAYFFDKRDDHHRTIGLGVLLWEKRFKKPDSKPEDRWEVIKDYVGGFGSGTLCFLNPDGLCPTVMGGSHWYLNGRNVSENAFKRLMGFPADYVFPEKPRNYRKDMRTYLSKGVMPPIARWILEVTAKHLGMTDHGLTFDHSDGPGSYSLTIGPDEIADFRIRKIDWWQRHNALPPLRHYDEHSHPPNVSFDIVNGVDDLTEAQATVLRQAQDALLGCCKIADDVPREDWPLMSDTIKAIEQVLNPPPPPVLEPKAKIKVPKPPKVDARLDGTVWTSGVPTRCLNPQCDAELPVDIVKTERPSMGVIIGEFICPTCGEKSAYSYKPAKVKKERVAREPRVMGDVVVPRGRLSDVHLTFNTNTVAFGPGPTNRKRSLMFQLIAQRGVMTHADAITACLAHPELQILPTTLHWHLRQLVKSGHLREITEQDADWHAAKAAGQGSVIDNLAQESV